MVGLATLLLLARGAVCGMRNIFPSGEGQNVRLVNFTWKMEERRDSVVGGGELCDFATRVSKACANNKVGYFSRLKYLR